MKIPTPPAFPPQSPERRAGPAGTGAAPVEIFRPEAGSPLRIEAMLLQVFPGMQHSVTVLRNLPRWLQDDMEELPTAIRTAMQEKLDGLSTHAAQLEAGLRTASALARLADHRVRPRRVDATPMIEAIVRQRMVSAGRSLDMRIELPTVITDAELLCGIVASLCEAAIANARRASDRIEIRGVHTSDTLRISALYPGPPLVAGEGTSLFDGTGQAGKTAPPAALGLAYVWEAVARLGGRIELGPGFRGVGARITAILPHEPPVPDAP